MTPPAKPKRMSEKRYRELYDSEPQYVEIPGTRFKACGEVSAEVIANTYRRQGITVTIRPVDQAADMGGSTPGAAKQSAIQPHD